MVGIVPVKIYKSTWWWDADNINLQDNVRSIP